MSCHLPSVASHHAYFLAKCYLNYTTKRKKKTSPYFSLYSNESDLFVFFWSDASCITICVLNILNVLKCPYANPVNAVCMRAFVIIFKVHSCALQIVTLYYK